MIKPKSSHVSTAGSQLHKLTAALTAAIPVEAPSVCAPRSAATHTAALAAVSGGRSSSNMWRQQQ
jgi:hypothetical protein